MNEENYSIRYQNSHGDAPGYESKHTPTPWRVQKKFEGPYVAFFTIGTKEWGVAKVGVGDMADFRIQQANAELIVRAVNSHAALLEAAKNFLLTVKLSPNPLDTHDAVVMQRAIAQAEARP